MTQVGQHHRILRPRGLPGYAPRIACCVCGKTASRDTVKQCQETSCPNLCHNSCLLDYEVFDCSNVATLRTLSNIEGIVVFERESDSAQPLSHNSEDEQGLTTVEEDSTIVERTSLLELEKEELVEKLLDIRHKLRTSQVISNNLR